MVTPLDEAEPTIRDLFKKDKNPEDFDDDEEAEEAMLARGTTGGDESDN